MFLVGFCFTLKRGKVFQCTVPGKFWASQVSRYSFISMFNKWMPFIIAWEQYALFGTLEEQEKVILPIMNIICINREDAVSGISSWDWNLRGNNSTYHALYPRAWTVYEGIYIAKWWTFCLYSFTTTFLDVSSYRVVTILS